MKAFPHPSLQEERHQLQLHPPASGDNGTLRSHDSKSRLGSVTPTMRVSSPALLRRIKQFIKSEFPSSQTCSLGQSQAASVCVSHAARHAWLGMNKCVLATQSNSAVILEHEKW